MDFATRLGQMTAVHRQDPHSERSESCTVVDGNIMLMGMEAEHMNGYLESDSSDQARAGFFPALREITGYLVFYNSKGVVDLSRVFPELSIIRGKQLFEVYSLIVFSTDLKELGIASRSIPSISLHFSIMMIFLSFRFLLDVVLFTFE